MAVTVYKANKEHRDPNTGTIYLDRPAPTVSVPSPKNGYQPTYQDAASPGGGANPQIGIAPQSVNVQQSSSQRTTGYQPFTTPGFTRREFTPSDDTDTYYNLMKRAERDKPGAFESRYEGAIQSILDGILNRKAFNLDTDANYSRLYDQAREKYMAAGNRAMRDTMGAMQAATGGYGSTAAMAAGSQAYDNYLQGLNDNNVALADLAYRMYGDETADRYNQLGAVTGLDNTDYGRHRDTVNDFYRDRDYYANRYDTFLGNDRRAYEFDTNLDWNEYQYDTDYKYRSSRDALSDYDDAFNRALSLAQQGLAIPEQYASRLEPETLDMLRGIAAQALMEQAAGGSGGGRGRGRSGSSKKTETTPSRSDYFESTGREKRSKIAGRQPIITPTAINAMDRYIYENVAGNTKEQSVKAKADVKGYIKKGYTADAIIDLLIESGYSDTVIASVLGELKI